MWWRSNRPLQVHEQQSESRPLALQQRADSIVRQAA
jgi:hypothetical protein